MECEFKLGNESRHRWHSAGLVSWSTCWSEQNRTLHGAPTCTFRSHVPLRFSNLKHPAVNDSVCCCIRSAASSNCRLFLYSYLCYKRVEKSVYNFFREVILVLLYLAYVDDGRLHEASDVVVEVDAPIGVVVRRYYGSSSGDGCDSNTE